MSAKISDLQERQIVNIADGKCLGNVKDIELNIIDGTIQALVLVGTGGLLGMLQNQGELFIPWEKVIRIGVDVVLIDMPELLETEYGCQRKRHRKANKTWEQEVVHYQNELQHGKQNGSIIVLPHVEKDENVELDVHAGKDSRC